MRIVGRGVFVAAVALASAVGCGSGGGAGGGGGGAAGGGGGTGTCPGEFGLSWEGTCAKAPSKPAQRSACQDSSKITEYCASNGVSAPQVACLAGAVAPMPAGRKATMAGFVKVFSGGGNSDKVKIEVFKAADITGADSLGRAAALGSAMTSLTQANVDAGTVRACPAKDVPGNPPCSPPSTDCSPACASDISLTGSGAQYCASGTCVDRLRYEAPYEIAGVDVDVPLVVRTSGAMGTSDTQWAPLVAFRVILASSDPICTDEAQTECWQDDARTTYRYFPNALSRSDYQVIPTSAGLSAGIPAGKGVVAGEVRDCQNVRLEFAQVGINPPASTFTYFNDSPFKTLPNTGRLGEGTDGLGLFAGLNVAPGAVTVAAVGLVDGANAALGAASVIVFADTVTTVLINGGRPIP
jgi:hypothetical protein